MSGRVHAGGVVYLDVVCLVVYCRLCVRWACEEAVCIGCYCVAVSGA